MSYIISVTAQDRSGIVAGVSEALLELGGNVEAASQTVHEGYFAMILLCSFDELPTPDALAKEIRSAAGADLHVYVTEHRQPRTPNHPVQTFIVTAVGPDRPGILHSLAEYLASKQVNVNDLYCTVREGDFVVICQTSVPANLDVARLQQELEAVGRKHGFTAHFQHENIFVATNELSLGQLG